MLPLQNLLWKDRRNTMDNCSAYFLEIVDMIKTAKQGQQFSSWCKVQAWIKVLGLVWRFSYQMTGWPCGFRSCLLVFQEDRLRALGPISLVFIVRKKQASCLRPVSPLHVISGEDSIDKMDWGLHSSSFSEKTTLFMDHALHIIFCSQSTLIVVWVDVLCSLLLDGLDIGSLGLYSTSCEEGLS